MAASSQADRALDASPTWLARAGKVALLAAAYGAFGVGAAANAALGVPAILIFSRDADRAERRVQRLLQRSFSAYFRIVEALGLVRLRCEGADRLLEPGLLVVANHPSRLDAIALIRFMPQADCIVKRAYFDNPLFRIIVRSAGYIPNDDGRALVAACTRQLLRGRTVLVVPEGTRSPHRGLAPMQRGAAHIALESGRDLLPVTVRCEPPSLGKNDVWWKVPDATIELTLTVGTPIRIEKSSSGQPTRGRAARAVTDAIRRHFEQELALDG
ncbi:MAG: 1-acyl-sn-glycerol-3-phosphate acyltransferase [Deltaproteobacteria bacterium]|nr:1-acyl-sn-glycerol-3-phosphate acyltransferase [Deltaproteobacteria bacterium]